MKFILSAIIIQALAGVYDEGFCHVVTNSQFAMPSRIIFYPIVAFQEDEHIAGGRGGSEWDEQEGGQQENHDAAPAAAATVAPDPSAQHAGLRKPSSLMLTIAGSTLAEVCQNYTCRYFELQLAPDFAAATALSL